MAVTRRRARSSASASAAVATAGQGTSSTPALLTALAGGLAASSCCALQLALNAAGYACAGFAALDPFRPVSLAATVLALVVLHRRHRSWRASAAAAALAASLTLLPAALAAAGRAGGLKAAAAALLPATAAHLARHQETILSVSGMKCAACGERARSAAAGVPGVHAAAVDWAGGTVSVSVGRDADPAVLASVEAALAEGGFEAVRVRDGRGE